MSTYTRRSIRRLDHKKRCRRTLCRHVCGRPTRYTHAATAAALGVQWAKPPPVCVSRPAGARSASRKHRCIKRLFTFFFSFFLSHFYVFNVFYFVFEFFRLTHARPARQSIVTVVCVSACNCKPRNHLR